MDGSQVNREHWDAMAAVHGEGRDRYDDVDAPVAATRTVEHAHALGEIVTAALDAGLRVDALREHLEVECDPRGGGVLALEADGVYRLRLAGTALPVLYTLVASRPQPQ